MVKIPIFADKYHNMSVEKQELIENQIYTIFSEKGFKSRLSEEDYKNYVKGTKRLNFVKGDFLFDDGVEANGVYFINKGIVKLSKCGVYGKDQILRFIKEGDLVGYRSILVGEESQAKAEAMSEVETTFIHADVFKDLLEVDVKLCHAMLQKLAYELGESSNTVTFLAQKTVRERLAEILLILEQKLGVNEEGYINISLTREEIANLIGTATESAIRLISEFKNDKFIKTQGRSIKLLNKEMLIKISHAQL